MNDARHDHAPTGTRTGMIAAAADGGNAERAMRRHDEARWHAVVSNDARADGRFVYAVRTTGIYCRPSCRSKRPRRDNVAYYETPQDAEAAGFRPCKRCRPSNEHRDARETKAIARACRLIERAETEPSLDELANAVGISRFHFHRLFRRLTGVTPKAYARAIRTRRLRALLDEGKTMTDAIHAAGFGSSSRFYADATEQLGMPAVAYRSGGDRIAIRVAVTDCSLGTVLIAATDQGLCDIRFGDDVEALRQDVCRRFPKATFVEADPTFERLVREVVATVESPRRPSRLPLDIQGTAFQRRVWQALLAIPPGTTATYGEIAERIGAPKAVRAVAGACAANRLAVAIPCHRVVRRDGSLSGYRWGVERKRALLGRESVRSESGTDETTS